MHKGINRTKGKDSKKVLTSRFEDVILELLTFGHSLKLNKVIIIYGSIDIRDSILYIYYNREARH